MICAQDLMAEWENWVQVPYLRELLPLLHAHCPPGGYVSCLAPRFELLPASQHLSEEQAEG